MKIYFVGTALVFSLLMPQAAGATEISIVQDQQQASTVETNPPGNDPRPFGDTEDTTLDSEQAETAEELYPEQTGEGAELSSATDQESSSSQDGSGDASASQGVVGKLEAVFGFLVEALSENPLISAGLNTDEVKGVVVVDTDDAGRNYLSQQLAATDFGDLVVFGADVAFGPGSQEVWNGGGSFQTYCTGAFPAQIGSQLGILTASHCYSDPNTSPIAYDGNIIQSIIKAPSAAGDITFIGLLGQTSGLTRTSASTYEPMSWFRNPVVGEGVCHFGITTGKSCSTVRAKYQFAQLQGEPLSNIGVAQSDISWFGDSGGPWFTNTSSKIAVGVHLGAYAVDGFVRSIFTMISVINSIQATLVLNGLQ